MKKIGFIIPWFGEDISGGAEMELRGLVTHLASAGNPVEVITTCVKDFNSDWSINYHKPGDYVECGVPVKRFPVRKRNTELFDQVNYKLMNNIDISYQEEEIYLQEMVNSPELYQYLQNNISEYSVFAFIPYMFGTTYYGMKSVLNKAILIPCLHDESYAYMKKFKELFPKIAGMIFHAQPEFELASSIYNLTNVKTAVLGEGIYTEMTYNGYRFKQKYGIERDYILYAGRKDSGKNVDILVKYFIQYKKKNQSDLKLLLIGGGEIDIPADSKRDIIDLGYIPIQDKYDAFAAAKLLCQPSKHESFSLVIMESWLCETPVLVNSECNVTKNFVQLSNGGLYFQNYYEFEGCVKFIMNNDDVSKIMGMNGRQFVLNNFSWDHIVEKYMTYFSQLVV